MNKKIPLRQCIGCREMKEKKEMIRVVRSPEGEYLLDETGKKNGRGAYLCKNRKCLGLAVSGHGLERSFHEAISKEVYDALNAEFDRIEE